MFKERSEICMMLQNHVMLVYTRFNSRGLDKIQVHSNCVHIKVFYKQIPKLAYYHMILVAAVEALRNSFRHTFQP